MPLKIQNFEWYLVVPWDDNYCACGYLICQYIDGFYFEQSTEDTVDVKKVVKHLKQK